MFWGGRRRHVLAMLAVGPVTLLIASCTAANPATTPSAEPSPALTTAFDCTDPIQASSTLAELASDPIAVDVMAILGGAPGSPTDPIQLNDSAGNDGFRFAKIGIAIKTGETFTITVPQPWQNRVRIGWGNHGEVAATTLRVSGCSSIVPGATWVVYPGGFRLKTAACVPLIVHTSTQRRTINVPIGKECP